MRSEVARTLEVAKEVKERIGAPTAEVEPVFADDSAGRVELLVGPPGVAEKIRKLQEKMNRERLAFKISEEIVYSSFGKDTDEDIIKQALSAGLAVLTPPCITAAPSEGIASAKVKKNFDGTNYLAVYFAGPIRAAGGTELAAAVVLADYLRQLFGLDRYKPSEPEIRRFIEELRTYTRRVGRFQYTVPEKTLEGILRNIPIEITGVATDRVLTPSFRNLPRIETNYLRGGALRVVNDGIVGRAKKILKLVNDMKLSGWTWLEDLVKAGTKNEQENENELGEYFEEVIGGRPIFSSPNSFGGFRLRYGRAPNTGMAALGVHPLTMKVLQNYLVLGTQLKTEYPGKGGIVTPVNTIEPPVILTRNGAVIKVSNEKLAEQAISEIDKILFLGDILVSFGDCLENNVRLRPCGYFEESWAQELQAKISNNDKEAVRTTGIKLTTLQLFAKSPLTVKPTLSQALTISEKLAVPLHPEYLVFWENSSAREILYLREWLLKNLEKKSNTNKGWLLPLNKICKEIMVRCLIEHSVDGENILLSEETLRMLVAVLAPDKEYTPVPKDDMDSIELLRRISGLIIKKKSGGFVGARMGRPEKAGPRKTSPPVHVLFPVGLQGGPTRNILAASKEKQPIELGLVTRECNSCGNITWKSFCEKCGQRTRILALCMKCGKKNYNTEVEKCDSCGSALSFYKQFQVDLNKELSSATAKLNPYVPPRLKGVQGLTSKVKQPELLEIGLLRAKHGLYVYKDGTVRYDSTNAPLTHFTPKQIGTSTKKLLELGYTHDVNGNLLINEHQLCELKNQDLIIPRKAAEYLLADSKFMDDVLTELAGNRPFYGYDKPEDLIGCLVAALSPHTYVAVVGRIIGIVDANVCYAHPIFHAAKRRDADGDEDGIMLLLDVLINFSRNYLPNQIGGRMDAPLLITTEVLPQEVDEQAHNLDVASQYPPSFYDGAMLGAFASEVQEAVPLLQQRLGTNEQYGGTGFTHSTSALVSENKESAYKEIRSMEEKIVYQLALTEKLVSVDKAVVVGKIITSHILPDILGNMRAYLTQSFRCKRCNTKFRRLPLSTKCTKCGGELMQTVFRGGIEKYLGLARKLLSQGLETKYLEEHILLALENVRSSFLEKTEEKSPADRQETLERFT